MRLNKFYQTVKPSLEREGSKPILRLPLSCGLKQVALAGALLFSLSGCSLYSKFQTPQAESASLVGSDVALADSLPPLLSWREQFTDKGLQELIGKALSANSDLLQAQLQIEQSEALLRGAKRAFLPSVALAPEGNLFKSKGDPTFYTYSLPLTMQWEVDLFGKLRNQKEQARSALLQTEAYAQGVRTQLIASVANRYYTLVQLDEQLRITHASIALQQKSLVAIQALKEAGRQTETAVNQAEADLYQVEASAEELGKQIRLVENSLTLLLNESPHRLNRTLFNQAEAPASIAQDSISLYALANRPDVKQAEYALRATFYGVNLARSAFYPSLSLSGSGGWSNGMGMITMPGTLLLSAAASLVQPIFSKGMNRANLAVAKSQHQQAWIAFEKALLVAGAEVNDLLTISQSSAKKLLLRQKQVAASQSAFQNSQALMQYSSMSYLEVLIAQSSALQAELLLTSDWLEGVESQINLYKALGGGLEAE